MTEEKHLNKYNQALNVHHIDPYRKSKDHTLENLVTLCKSCHIKIENTSREEILETGGQSFVASEIIEVKHLKNFEGEKRYNFEVEDDHSYVAKGIVTHNCECTQLPWSDMYEELGTFGSSDVYEEQMRENENTV